MIRILITVNLTLETMKQLIMKPRRRPLVPEKKFKKFKIIQKTRKNTCCKYVFLYKIAKIRDIKILKNIKTHLETTQQHIMKL